MRVRQTLRGLALAVCDGYAGIASLLEHTAEYDAYSISFSFYLGRNGGHGCLLIGDDAEI